MVNGTVNYTYGKGLEEHKGHESMHLQMALIFFISMIGLQVILQRWRLAHYTSYFQVTLFLLWIVPFIISIYQKYVRMMTIWTLFTLGIFCLYTRVKRGPFQLSTPRLVYSCYFYTHLSSEILVSSALLLFFIGVFNSNEQVSILFANTSFLLCFYGLYFGLLTRDIAYLLSESINIRLGMISDSGLPRTSVATNICALCGLPIVEYFDDREEINVNCLPGIDLSNLTSDERVLKLECKHNFHEFCIRGWILIGKKETCPCCKEKVNLRRAFLHPWDKANLYYGDLLHVLRYLLAWHPLLLFFLYLVNKILGLK